MRKIIVLVVLIISVSGNLSAKTKQFFNFYYLDDDKNIKHAFSWPYDNYGQALQAIKTIKKHIHLLKNTQFLIMKGKIVSTNKTNNTQKRKCTKLYTLSLTEEEDRIIREKFYRPWDAKRFLIQKIKEEEAE